MGFQTHSRLYSRIVRLTAPLAKTYARKDHIRMEPSSHSPQEGGGWSPSDPGDFPPPPSDIAHEMEISEASTVELEPGWSAVRSLAHMGSDDFLAVMLRPSFRPVGDLDLVPITPCPHCHDGGQRTAGTVRTRRGRELVRACDTCGKVETGAPSWFIPPIQ